MSTIANPSRDFLARCIKAKRAFKLKILSAGVVLKPVYIFRHELITDGTYVARFRQLADDHFWAEIGQVTSCDFCADEGKIFYSVVLTNRAHDPSCIQTREMPSRSIDCVFDFESIK